MNSLITRITLTFFGSCILSSSGVFGGGGYVGNGPVPTALALLSPSIRSPLLWNPDDQTSAPDGNFFLLSRGQFELTLGLFSYIGRGPELMLSRDGIVPADNKNRLEEKRSLHLLPSLDLSYGITSNVTWHGLTGLKFGLINKGGSGYEMAGSIGLTTNGFNGKTAAPYIAYFSPGATLYQTWTFSRFRIVNTIFGSIAMFDDFELTFGELGTSLHLFFDLTESLRIGANAGLGFYKQYDKSAFSEPKLLGPSAVLTYQASSYLGFSLITRFQLENTKLPQPGLMMSVRW